MNYMIQDREEKKLFQFFEEISAIARPSGKEEAIRDYLVSFAKQRGFEVISDSHNNVLIRIPPSADRKDAPPLILQGHMDMVFITDSEHTHHSEDTPVTLCYDGHFIRALGTSLGADNGVAVAIQLALAEDLPPSHPPLELVFTASEEIGLIGAKNFDCSLLKGKRMINLDGGEDGVAIIGCAGGRVSVLKKRLQTVAIPATSALRLSLVGLQGGHSGVQIHQPLGNALKHMGELLSELSHYAPFHLCQINGGTVDNAIPSHCDAVLLPQSEKDLPLLTDKVRELADAFLSQWKSTDPDATVEINSVTVDAMICDHALDLLPKLIQNAPHGVQAYSETHPDTVADSINFAAVQTTREELTLTFSVRSFSEQRKENLSQRLESLAEEASFQLSTHGDYPGWEPCLPSPLLDAYLATYKTLHNKTAQHYPIHAGLECGIFSQAIPGLDAISICCNTKDVHTPDECLDADSFERFYGLIRCLLGTL